MSENIITADYVSAALRKAGAVGLQCSEASLKRLTHVQHICRCVFGFLVLVSRLSRPCFTYDYLRRAEPEAYKASPPLSVNVAYCQRCCSGYVFRVSSSTQDARV